MKRGHQTSTAPILEKKLSVILSKLDETDLYEAHLHLFALQKLVFESLGLGYLLPQIQKLEALHGPDYVRAWKAVQDDLNFYNAMIAEIKNNMPEIFGFFMSSESKDSHFLYLQSIIYN